MKISVKISMEFSKFIFNFTSLLTYTTALQTAVIIVSKEIIHKAQQAFNDLIISKPVNKPKIITAVDYDLS